MEIPSHLLTFDLYMIPMKLILKKKQGLLSMGKKQFRINQLLIMENLNLFGKSKDQLITRLKLSQF